MMRVLYCLCVLTMLYSCGNKKSSEKGKILAKVTMQQVMWDILLADAFTEKYLKTDSSKKELVQNAALQEKIFALHKISKADFYTSYDYYSTQPDVMRIILDSVNAAAERQRSIIMMERYGGTSITPIPAEKDSIIRRRQRR